MHPSKEKKTMIQLLFKLTALSVKHTQNFNAYLNFSIKRACQGTWNSQRLNVKEVELDKVKDSKVTKIFRALADQTNEKMWDSGMVAADRKFKVQDVSQPQHIAEKLNILHNDDHTFNFEDDIVYHSAFSTSKDASTHDHSTILNLFREKMGVELADYFSSKQIIKLSHKLSKSTSKQQEQKLLQKAELAKQSDSFWVPNIDENTMIDILNSYTSTSSEYPIKLL